MPKMVVKNRMLHYGGQQYKIGDQFEASDVDARFFQKRDRADPAPVMAPALAQAPTQAPARSQVQQRAAPEAEKPKPVAPAVTAAAPMTYGEYGRRDMRAED